MRGEEKSCGTARFCSQAADKHTDVPPSHRVQPALSHTVHFEHLILYSIHRTATDRWWAMSHSNTHPVRNRVPLTARSSNLRWVSAAEHHTAEQYSKTGRIKPRKHLPRSDLSWNTRQHSLCASRHQVFVKLPYKPSEDPSKHVRRYWYNILFQ